MSTISDQSAIELAKLEDEAKRLYEHDIVPMWSQAKNVWRTAWAMDTILDYYRVCGVDGSGSADTALNALDPRNSGAWWDDFGWIGITALRAVEQNAYPAQRDLFLKIAINAWVYMYGPGWATNGSGAIYPFMDSALPGWADFADGIAKTPIGNIGAPNVWDRMDCTFRCDLRHAQAPGQFASACTGPQPASERKYRQQPRYSPGGAWNSPIYSDQCPYPSPAYVGDNGALNPAQNTVTNTLFALLSLRLFQASANHQHDAVFQAANLDVNACLASWQHQAEWFDRWCQDKTLTPDQTLSTIPADSSDFLLIRERVSTYLDSTTNTVYWDPNYDSNRVWTGDQGLMLAVLREGQALQVKAPTFAAPEALVAAVFRYGYAERSYNSSSQKCLFPLPWLELGTRGDARFRVAAPGGDPGDYRTGVAVFMRYLLQAYEATPAILSQEGADILLKSAFAMQQGSGFGSAPADPGGECDAFTAHSVDTADKLTPLINRLSVILMAIAICKSSGAARTG